VIDWLLDGLIVLAAPLATLAVIAAAAEVCLFGIYP
jgi:hypothetical protein